MDNQSQINFDFPNLNTMTAEDFYKTYRPFMFAIAQSQGFDKLDTDEIINDLMIKIFMEKKCGYNPECGSFRNYLVAMVRNECRSRRRKGKNVIYYEEQDLERLSDENDMSCQPRYISKEFISMIEEAIRQLRKEVRSQLQIDAFVMTVIHEERPMDVAKKINVRPDYVSLAKTRYLPRFRAILRAIIER